MWIFSYELKDIWEISQVYLILIGCVCAISLIMWATHAIRICQVEFKNFPVKWQARVSGILGAVINVIIIAIWLFQPNLIKVAGWLVLLHLILSAIYKTVMVLIGNYIMQTGTLVDHLRDLHATEKSNVVELQKQLQDWYKKHYSIKRIQSALQDMSQESREKE